MSPLALVVAMSQDFTRMAALSYLQRSYHGGKNRGNMGQSCQGPPSRSISSHHLVYVDGGISLFRGHALKITHPGDHKNTQILIKENF